MKAPDELERVELLNVPLYQQGEFDGLCAYYAGAMMLAALYPRFSTQFGELRAKRGTRRTALDPMVRHYVGEYRKAPPGRDDRYVLARMFYEGQYVRDVGNTLNNIMRDSEEATRFKISSRPVNDRTFDAISESINSGLPVLIGWDTTDYGTHAVLVKGYWHGDDDWLLLNDPGGDTQMSWQVLRSAVERKLEFVRCDPETHAGPRPDKALTSTEGTVQIHRWVPEKRYVSLERHFQKH